MDLSSLPEEILQKVNEIGIALAKERYSMALLEKILESAKELTHADGGTMYRVTAQGTLRFVISLSDSLQFHWKESAEHGGMFPSIPLFLEEGKSNDTTMVTYAVNHKTTVCVEDAYDAEGFDFSGTRRFDENMGYRTRAVLTIPLKNHEGEVIAVLQLINPQDPLTHASRIFSKEDKALAESLAAQAGLVLNNQLLLENLRHLLDALIRVIAEAIDEKSPSTGNHAKRVPVLARLLAEAVEESQAPPFRDLHFTEEQLHELEIAALLHDCGKITTPVHVMEKHTKLETLWDKISLIEARFAALQERIEKEMLRKKLQWMRERYPEIEKEAQPVFSAWETQARALSADLREKEQFLQRCNQGKESLGEEARNRLEACRKLLWRGEDPLLSEEEWAALSVAEGNLTPAERAIIQNHVVLTYRMLSQLPFPKDLKEVPEIAASHHERMDGKGYPRGIPASQTSLRARILAIADVFEALSAPDRPYRRPLPLSQILKALQKQAQEGALDPDLVQLFLTKKVYLPYAHKYLAAEQIDIPDKGD